ncbi:hypothetical protein [Halobacillus amylolyticus]|uniref:Uncharacterized protein n=1 Tax=Halobacillus amylolyticus TaxID=2932259 RepID=A0ABY4HH53_9BACI|nr:hypothetical protein [Halobacillus amylolyticus]UOR14106.1 hypothetical protein MUO15_21360 [Halobacillus amylolyticus]
MAFIFTVMSVDSVMTESFKLKKGYLFILVYVGFGVAYFITHHNKEKINDKEREIRRLKDENTEQRENLKDHAKSLWKEMTKINVHAHNENVLKVFEKFIMNNSNVVAVELYDYYFQDGSGDTDVTIKINHSLGLVMENKDHNTILQNYYHIPKHTLDKFNTARYMFHATYNQLEDKKPLIQFFTEIRKELSGKDIEYNKNDVIKFALLVLAGGLIDEFLQRVDNSKVRDVDLLEKGNEGKTQDLFEKAKTGILRGILDDGEFYSFNYKKKNGVPDKEKRLYVTRKVLMRGKPSIFVITVDNNENVNDKSLMDSFIRLLEIEQSIEVEYNNNKDGVRRT